MRIILLIILITPLYAYCQEDKELFDNGIKLYSTDTLRSIDSFKKIISDHKKSKFYSISIYNLGQIYAEIDSINQSIYWFSYAIDARFKDNLDWHNFPDTHSNIKHKSAHDLGHIYYKKEDYLKALEYYLKSLNEYPYYSRSGTSIKKNNIKVSRWISDCYLALGDTVQAVNSLMSDAITASPWLENPVAIEVIELIEQFETKESFLKRLDFALKSMEKRKDCFSIILYNHDVMIYPYGSRMKDLSKNEFIELIKGGEFYLNLLTN